MYWIVLHDINHASLAEEARGIKSKMNIEWIAILTILSLLSQTEGRQSQLSKKGAKIKMRQAMKRQKQNQQHQQHRRQEHNPTLPNASGATRMRSPFELDYDKLFKTQTNPKALKKSSRKSRGSRGATRALGTFVNDFLPGVIDMIPGAKVGIAALHSIISKFLTTGL